MATELVRLISFSRKKIRTEKSIGKKKMTEYAKIFKKKSELENEKYFWNYVITVAVSVTFT